LICFGFAIGRCGPRFALKEPDPSVLLREFSVQSVASINSPDLPPAPAPDRKDKGGDSFSLMLDTAAKPPDNPAPEAGPSAGGDSSPPPSKTQARPLGDSSAQPKDDSGKAKASGESSAGDASKVGDVTAEKKNSGKGSKQSASDDSVKGAVLAAVVPDQAQNVPITGTVVAISPPISLSLDAPRADDGGNAATGDGAKTAIEIAATAGATLPVAPVALDSSKPSTGTTPVATEGAAQVAATIETTAKGKLASTASDTPAVANEAPKGAASAVPAAKAFAEAAKPIVANDGSEPNSKPLATDKADSGNSPIQPTPVSAEESKPSGGNPAAIERLAAKATPDSHAPVPASANQDLGAAAARDVSATAQLAQSALPEPLRILASSLGPASAEVHTGASNQGVPATNAAIAIEIVARANQGSRQFDIRLDPPELGRIEVRLDVDKSGEVITRLTVDRPETLQLLQNDARGLERALQSAGLKTEDGSLQFSLRQQSPDGSAGQQAQGGTDPRSGTVYVEDDEPASAGLEQYQRAASLRGGVDIRV
jgi:flagellar hook-length control protein FliK